MLFFAVCIALIGLAVGAQLRFARRERALKHVSWDDLIGRLRPMNTIELQKIADCFLHPDAHQLRVEPGTMWETVGGLAGLQQLNSNVEVMLQLAIYAERWNDANGRVLSEIMRRDAVRVQACVQKIELSMLTRRGLVYLGMELQEAIASYCLLRARLLGMYTECHAGLLPKLSGVV